MAKTRLISNIITTIFTIVVMLLVLEFGSQGFYWIEPAPYPPIMALDEDLCTINKPNLNETVITKEFSFNINTNPLGFRAPHKIQKGGVMVLGDSFFMGYGVENQEI